DNNPGNGHNFYRIKLTSLDGKIKYTNTVVLHNTRFDIVFYPNPVNNELYISFVDDAPRNYSIEFRNLTGQVVFAKKIFNITNAVTDYPRNSFMTPGIYTVTITDLDTGEKFSNKILYK
ncbi:MAG: T9SS type A sorting domain-containing protein, partial [Ginsengibacter sp.]